MSWFNQIKKKLLPAKNAWKNFTYKLKSKLHKHKHKLKNSKSIKKTTRHLIIILRSTIHRLLNFSNKKRALNHPTSIFSHTNQQIQFQNNSFSKIYVDDSKTFSVHAAKGGETSSNSSSSMAAKGKNVVVNDTPNIKNKSVGGYIVDDAWKAAVASSPQLMKGVDERAESVHAAKGGETSSNSSSSMAAKGKNVALNDTPNIKNKAVGGYSVHDAWKAAVASSPQLMKGVDERAEEFIYKFREDMKLQKEISLVDYQKMLARSA